MSYKESDVTCDWCKTAISDGEDVACNDCYEKQESELSKAKAEIESLEHRIAELETAEEASQ